MDRESKSNRSLLALAGERSLNNNPSSTYIKPYIKQNRPAPVSPLKLNNSSSSTVFDPKQIIKKLGLGRLRKMQALVRGFLVRRTVYPRQLQSYLIAQSALELIVANVIYREVSGLVVETVALGHYDNQEGGEARMLEEYLYNAVIRRVIEQEFLPIARQAVYETAIYASRPEITFGFNLRDPLELCLFLRINAIIEEQSREVAELALREQAAERRELQVMDELVWSMGIVQQLCGEVVEECLLQGVQEYAVESILGSVVKEGARVVAEVVYNQKVNEIQDKHIEDIKEQVEDWLLQQCILSFIVNMQQKNNRSLPNQP